MSSLLVQSRSLKTIVVVMALSLCMTLSAEAAVPSAVSNIGKSLVTVSVMSPSGALLRSGPGVIIDREGIVLCSCSLIAKWAENLDYTLVVTLPHGSQMPIANLLSRPCSQGISYFRIAAEGLSALTIARGSSRAPRDAYYIVSHSSQSPHLRTSPLPSSPSDYFGRKASASLGLHLQINQRGEALHIALTDSSKSGKQTYTLKAEELNSRLSLLRKTARRLAEAAKLPAPDALPAVPPGRSPSPEIMASIEALKRQAALTPQDPGVHIALGKAYESANMNAEAIQAFADAVSRDPQSVRAHIHLGLAYYRTARYQDAIKAFSTAAEIEPSLAEAHAKLATVHMITGEYQRAVDSLRKALSVSPGEPSLHFTLGLAYYLQGDKSGALGEYAILQRLNGEWAERLADLMY